MKKNFLFFICLILLFLLTLLVFCHNRIVEFSAPTKSSVWIGDTDFGCWYDVTEIDSINYVVRIRIYHDYDTGIWQDAYYINKSRSIKPFTKQNILNSILDYDVNTGSVKLKDGDDVLNIIDSTNYKKML